MSRCCARTRRRPRRKSPFPISARLSVYGFVACKHCSLTMTRLDSTPQSRRFYDFTNSNATSAHQTNPRRSLTSSLSTMSYFDNVLRVFRSHLYLFHFILRQTTESSVSSDIWQFLCVYESSVQSSRFSSVIIIIFLSLLLASCSSTVTHVRPGEGEFSICFSLS